MILMNYNGHRRMKPIYHLLYEFSHFATLKLGITPNDDSYFDFEGSLCAHVFFLLSPSSISFI